MLQVPESFIQSIMKEISQHTALEAKALAYLAFQKGPIENIYSGKMDCPTCHGDLSFSRISGPEMKEIMKAAVDRLATLLTFREVNPQKFASHIVSAEASVKSWDPPQPVDGYLYRGYKEIYPDAIS
jgi:hypothetical protein